MKNLFLSAVIMCFLANLVYSIPSNVTAFFRDGQTFITWTEDGSVSYDVYRHTEVITSGNIGAAVKIATVNNQSSNTVFNIGNVISQTHWIIQPKTSGTGLGTELTDNDGLLVYTTKEASGDFYYAVCAGGTTTLSGNTVGPITEQKMVTKPIPVWRGTDGNGRLNVHYEQFMDYTIWNTDYDGYIFNFLVSFPSEWEQSASMGVLNILGGRSQRLPQTIPDASAHNIQMQCEAVATSNGLQDWYYGHRNKDSSAVYNYTEYRIIKAFLYVCSDLKGDINRIFQYGSSMGGSGSLTLAERYPSVISAAFCCQPQTDWSNTSAVWYGEAPLNYGPPSQNLPIYNIPFEDPAYPEIDSNLQRYNGTPVYDWQNVREQLIVRAEADMALICATHGTADESIDWPTQGAPFGPVLRNSRRPFKYVVNGSGHNWQGFNAVNFSQMFTTGGCYENGCPYAFECDKSIPGFSGIDESNTLVSASWTVVADSTDVWSMTISGVGQTCDITPRRCQSFCAYPDDRFDVFVGGALHQSNVTADAAGLVTATNVNLSSTQTIRIVSTYRNPMRATSTVSVPAEERDIQAFPNPFNPDVRIRFYNPKKDHVLMTIYSIDGTLIKKAMDRNLPAGIFASAYWDGTDISNKKVPSGIYVVKLTMLGVNRVTRIMKIQ